MSDGFANFEPRWTGHSTDPATELGYGERWAEAVRTPLRRELRRLSPGPARRPDSWQGMVWAVIFDAGLATVTTTEVRGLLGEKFPERPVEDPSVVSNALRRLMQRGHLGIIERGSGQRPSRYRVIARMPAEVPKTVVDPVSTPDSGVGAIAEPPVVEVAAVKVKSKKRKRPSYLIDVDVRRARKRVGGKQYVVERRYLVVTDGRSVGRDRRHRRGWPVGRGVAMFTKRGRLRAGIIEQLGHSKQIDLERLEHWQVKMGAKLTKAAQEMINAFFECGSTHALQDF